MQHSVPDDGAKFARPYRGGATHTPFDTVASFLEDAPVDLPGMAKALGLRVDMHAGLIEGASGRIVRESSSSPNYLIEVNGAHSHARQRFTLAHEIAHFLLHRQQIGDGITDDALYRSGLGDHIETEANRMAAELTMPAKLVRTLWRSGIRGLTQLCEIFEVSEAALRIRLKQLRLDM